MPRRTGGLAARLLEEVEDRTGFAVRPREEVTMLEAYAQDYRVQQREMELMGWHILDKANPQEVSAESRREWARKARVVWLNDPQVGASVDLMNDFAFGRGVPKPRAKDDEVQKVIDEAWDDPDNQLILTSYTAQVALGTDLSLQSNLFFLMFEGDDGKVKLGLLNHDEVENAVRDPDFRQRVLYYLARHQRVEWDYENDCPKVDLKPNAKPIYYEHWRNVEAADSEGSKFQKPPANRLGDGRVYHVAINRTSEQVFGSPQMRRLLRWVTAYNDFMAARVDMAKAAAAFIMRRKVKGTPSQVARIASKAISRGSELAGATGTGPDGVPQMPPRGGSILTENENVTHENLSLNSNASAAAQDAQMIRANISASVRWPQAYLGDPTASNLATAQSLELPVLKAVEARQEVFEGVFRWFLDRTIERAVDAGRLSKTIEPNAETGAIPVPGDTGAFGPTNELAAAYEDQNADEQATERDLSYEFSMPSPLRRMMTDLVTAIGNVAQTFDPNNTNTELSRVLLTIALGEGLEVQDPADAVKRIFPEGYEDPALAQAQQQGGPFGAGGGFGTDPNQGGFPGADGQQHTEANPYGVAGGSPAYQAAGGGAYMQQALKQRNGEPVDQAAQRLLTEQRYRDLPETAQVRFGAGMTDIQKLYEEDVVAVVNDELARVLHGTNGHTTE